VLHAEHTGHRQGAGLPEPDPPTIVSQRHACSLCLILERDLGDLGAPAPTRCRTKPTSPPGRVAQNLLEREPLSPGSKRARRAVIVELPVENERSAHSHWRHYRLLPSLAPSLLWPVPEAFRRLPERPATCRRFTTSCQGDSRWTIQSSHCSISASSSTVHKCRRARGDGGEAPSGTAESWSVSPPSLDSAVAFAGRPAGYEASLKVGR
jgi:hypothetical protein